MALPDDARRRLTAPVRHALADGPVAFRDWHTLPIGRHSWTRHSRALVDEVADFGATWVPGCSTSASFNQIRDWLSRLLGHRGRLTSLLLALQPFEPFDADLAGRLVAAIDANFVELLQALECGQPYHPSLDVLDQFRGAWPVGAGGDERGISSVAFGVDDSLTDALGEFSPARVFQAYAYDNGRLVERLGQHLLSAGLGPVHDILAMVCTVGWVTVAEDQVVAFAAMDSLLSRLSLALEQAPAEARRALNQVHGRESALRLGRRRVNLSLASMEAQGDPESRALALADIYKRIVEGPVRQYSWLLHCLSHGGAWSDPPMLTSLKQSLMADGGWLASFARSALLTEMRNGEAHEALTWDGRRQAYLVDGGTIDIQRVVLATVTADSFARGCEAALAYYRAWDSDRLDVLPSPEASGRQPAWRRAEAYFGLNGLLVTEARFNAAVGEVRVERLDREDINPCFQALVCARRLLPNIEAFEIRVADSFEPAIRVTADALDRTDPVWSRAVTSLAVIPPCTFLPANLNTRGRLEGEGKAIRSVAWIAADDLLDALDCTPDCWDDDDLALFSERLAIVKLALQQCTAAGAGNGRNRIDILLKSVFGVESELDGVTAPLTRSAVDGLASIRRIRQFWETWGPVGRLPTVFTERSAGHAYPEYRPYLRKGEVQRWGI